MQEIRDRVAVVTGAASGIGLALAQRLASAGARLVLADIEGSALEAAAEALERGGAEVFARRTDVSSAESVEGLAREALNRFGSVDLLFANAGVIQAMGPTWERPVEDYEWVLGVNLWGPIHCVRSFVPRMLQTKQPAHIVITASMSGLSVVPGNGPYQISKHGAVALAETLRLELNESAIGVSCLCPGFVPTGILHAERNRPSHLRREDAPPERPLEGGWTGEPTPELEAIARAPEEIAEQVMTAVREDRFWILTHEDARARLLSRFDALLESCRPH
jgi:NAD(P)-dependent dehydrogenase (short-subunit alcohol dehydrogenase family)